MTLPLSQKITRVQLPFDTNCSQGLVTDFVEAGQELNYARKRFSSIFGKKIALATQFEILNPQQDYWEIWKTYKGEKRLFLTLCLSYPTKKTGPFTSEIWKDDRWQNVFNVESVTYFVPADTRRKN